MNLDKYGLIVTHDGDGGDSLHLSAFWTLGKFWIDSRDMLDIYTIRHCQIENGNWIRNPDPSKWYSDPRTTSRDQLISLVIFLGEIEWFNTLEDTFYACLKRGMVAQNTHRIPLNPSDKPTWKVPDTMLTHLSIFLRAMNKWTWALPITDVCIYLGVASLCFMPVWNDKTWRFQARSGDDVDDKNMIAMLIQSQKVHPTFVSRAAVRMYRDHRPSNFGVSKLMERHPVMGALAWDVRDDAPEFVELWRPLIEEYILKT